MKNHYHVWCLAVLATALYLAPAPAESTIVLTHTNMENSTMYAGTRVKKRTGNNRAGIYIFILEIYLYNPCLGTVIITYYIFI